MGQMPSRRFNSCSTSQEIPGVFCKHKFQNYICYQHSRT